MKRQLWILLLPIGAVWASDPGLSAYHVSELRTNASLVLVQSNIYNLTADRSDALNSLNIAKGNAFSASENLTPASSDEQRRTALSLQKDQKRAEEHLASITSRLAKAELLKADLQSSDCPAPADSEEGKEHIATRDRDSRTSYWKWFQFCKADSLFGGVGAKKDGDATTVTVNAINYKLWLGGPWKLPFQLLLSKQANDSDKPSAVNDTNQATLLDAESGYAIRFPILGVYQPTSDKFKLCNFSSWTMANIGHCMAGGDLTVSFKPFKKDSGATKNAFTATARLGGSLLFPILAAADDSHQGYLAIQLNAAYTYAKDSNLNQIFAPITDAQGNTVTFKNKFGYAEAAVKFAIDKHLSIAGTWIKPFAGGDYLKSRTYVTVESQF